MRGRSCSPPRSPTRPADFSHLDPMITAALGELEQAGVTDRPQVALADASTGTSSTWTR